MSLEDDYLFVRGRAPGKIISAISPASWGGKGGATLEPVEHSKPKKEKYRCLNCGERFKVDLYSPEEKRDAQRQGVQFSPIRCPKCGRSDYREGWD